MSKRLAETFSGWSFAVALQYIINLDCSLERELGVCSVCQRGCCKVSFGVCYKSAFGWVLDMGF